MPEPERSTRPLGVAGLKGVVASLTSGLFSEGDKDLFQPIADSLLDNDEFMLLADFAGYVECCERAAKAYEDRDRWIRMSILNAARCGFFSSDRTIRQYCEEIWQVQPVEIKSQH